MLRGLRDTLAKDFGGSLLLLLLLFCMNCLPTELVSAAQVLSTWDAQVIGQRHLYLVHRVCDLGDI